MKIITEAARGDNEFSMWRDLSETQCDPFIVLVFPEARF
jgi:hypothetical protein